MTIPPETTPTAPAAPTAPPVQPDRYLHWLTADIDGKEIAAVSLLSDTTTAVILRGGGQVVLHEPVQPVRDAVNAWKVAWGNFELALHAWHDAEIDRSTGGPSGERGPTWWDVLGSTIEAAIPGALRAGVEHLAGPGWEMLEALGVPDEVRAQLEQLAADDRGPSESDALEAFGAVIANALDDVETGELSTDDLRAELEPYGLALAVDADSGRIVAIVRASFVGDSLISDADPAPDVDPAPTDELPAEPDEPPAVTIEHDTDEGGLPPADGAA